MLSAPSEQVTNGSLIILSLLSARSIRGHPRVMPHNERRSVTEALARYAKQLQLAAPDAMRQKRYLDNVTEMAIATNGHLRPVYASGPMARSRRCALKARRTTWLRSVTFPRKSGSARGVRRGSTAR